MVDVANYPFNTELSVHYVYDNGSPSVGGPEFEDGRYVTVGYRHALLPMPDEGFTLVPMTLELDFLPPKWMT